MVEFRECLFDRDAELLLDVGSHAAEGTRRDSVLKLREDLDVLQGEEVWAAAEGLPDLNHETLKAEGGAVDTAGAL